MNKKQETTFLARVKERVDFIYGLLIECPDGYHGGLHQDCLTNEVTRALIKRGVVKRDKDNTRARLVYIYKWVAALAPTKTLYTNIMVDVRDARKEYYGKAKDKKKEAPVVEIPTPLKDKDEVRKDTGLRILEYNEKEGTFHINEVWEFNDGRRCTTDVMNTYGWASIGIFPEKEMFDEIINWEKNFVNKESLKFVIESFKERFGKRYWYDKLNGLHLNEESKKLEQAESCVFDRFSTQELWDEIKRSGYSIEGSRLVITRKEYLE